MLNSKFVIALIAIVATVFTICRFGGPNAVVEKFLNHAQTSSIQYGSCASGHKQFPYTMAQQSLAANYNKSVAKMSQGAEQQLATVQQAPLTVANNQPFNQSTAGTFNQLKAAIPGQGHKVMVEAQAAQAQLSAPDQIAQVGVSGLSMAHDQAMGKTYGELTSTVENYASTSPVRPSGCGSQTAEFYQVPGFIQQAPPPRHGASVAYGPNITYKPPRNHMATKYDYPNMVKEGYKEGQACSQGMSATLPYAGGANVIVGSSYRNNEEGFTSALDQGKDAAGKQAKAMDVIDSSLPVNSMEFINADGAASTGIVCNHVVAINRPKNRIGMGDSIRGDLAIPPPCGNWFTSSWGIDGLNQGAMNVLSGSMDQQLQSLLYMNTGRDTLAGGTIPVETLASTLATTVPGALATAAVTQAPLTATRFP